MVKKKGKGITTHFKGKFYKSRRLAMDAAGVQDSIVVDGFPRHVPTKQRATKIKNDIEEEYPEGVDADSVLEMLYSSLAVQAQYYEEILERHGIKHE